MRRFGIRQISSSRALRANVVPVKPVKMHEKHTMVDTKEEENLVPRSVPPLKTLPQGNLISHILDQYKGDNGKYHRNLSWWQQVLGEKVIKVFNLDMDRIRSGPVAGALYRDQCKYQAYFEKGAPLSPTADFYFNKLGMPSTFFQWYQIEILHVWMLYVRMRAMPRKYCREYQQKLVNGVFDDIDFQLREVLRVNSDRTTNNYKKQFSQQLKGSVFSYDEALTGGDTILASALWRNLFEQSDLVDLTILDHLVHYIRANLYILSQMSDSDFAAGLFRFLDVRLTYEPLNEGQNNQLTEMIESARKDSSSLGTRTAFSRDGW